MAPAWEKMEFAREIDSHRSLMRRYAPNRPTRKGWDTVARTPTKLLDRYPVDVLVIDRSESVNRSRSTKPDWFRLLKHTPSNNLPRVVLILFSPAELVQHDGGRGKGLRKQMLALSYCQRCVLVSYTDQGGAVASDRLVTSYTLKSPDERPGALRSIYRGPYPRYYWTAKGNVESLTTLQCSTDGLPCTVIGKGTIGTRQRTRHHATSTGLSYPKSTGCSTTPTR